MNILTDYNSEESQIPEGLAGDVFDETVGLDVESPSAEDTKICDDTPPPLPDQQTQQTDSSSMLTPTPEHEHVPNNSATPPGHTYDCYTGPQTVTV